MASWFSGLSSSLGSCLGQMSHSVVSFTRHISRCTKDVRMMEHKIEESNELRRKEVETTKKSVRPKIERFMTFDSDLDLENKQETAAYSNLLIKGDLDIKLFIGKEILEKQKFQNLQEDTQSVNVAAGFVPATSSTSASENIDPKASEFKHELEQKNLEMTILRERHEAMNRKFLKLQEATISINVTTSLVSPTPASISLGDNIDHNASEYEHQLKQQNLEMKILRGRNVAMQRKLLRLQKATECVTVAAGLLPATSSTPLGKNINPIASKYKHELEEKNLEVKILRGRNVAMKHKLLNLQKVAQCLNVAAGLVPATPASTSLAENVDHKTAEYKHQLEQQNLEMKILRGRNVAMKHKLLKLLKATQCLNAAAGLVPATSSISLGENINPSASACKHELKQKSLKVKILREEHRAMNRKLFKLENASESINMATGLIPATSPTSSLGDDIDHNASEFKHQLEQQNLEMKILRGRNVAIKSKILRLQKATECLNVAAALLPAMTSAALAENIDPSTSQYKRELEQKNLEVKILRGRNVAMKHKLLNLQKTTQCLNVETGLVPTMPILTSLGDNINHNASEYENQFKQENLEMKILRGRNIAMKHKLLNLQKAIQCLNVAAGRLPAITSASLGENIDPSAAEYKHELERKNLEMKILREIHRAMKCKLFKLQKATESINVAAGLLPATSSTSLGKNIDLNAFECKHHLEQNNLKMRILSERYGAMKHKILKVENATESINLAAALIPATSPSTSLRDNIDHNATEYEHQLEQQNLEVKILRKKHGAMKRKLLKLQKATESTNTTTSLIPATPALISLGDNIDRNASEYEHQLKQKNLEVKILRGRNIAMKHKLLNLQKAAQRLNVAAGLVPTTPASTSLAENIDHKASAYKHQLGQQNLDMKILRGRNVTMKHKLLKLLKATQCLNVAAGFIPATSSTSLGENIDPSASACKLELKQKNLDVKIVREGHRAMNRKLLKVENATESINLAAALIPATSPSTSLRDNIDHNATEYEHQLEQQNLEVKILREKHGAMKRKLLKLQKATESTNTTTSLIPATPALISLGDNIDHNAPEYEHQLKQQNLEMKILRGRNVAMQRKLLKLQKATECLNAAAGLLPAMSSTPLGENIDPNASEYEHQLKQKNLEAKILRGRNIAMKHKLLNLQKAAQCLNVAAGLIPATPASPSLAENINHKAFEYKHQLEQQNLEMKILRGRNVAMKHKLQKLLKATQCLNVAAGLISSTSSTSLGKNINPSASACKHELKQKNLDVKIVREGHRAMNHKLLKLENATKSINTGAGLIPAMSSLGDDIDHNASEYKHQLDQQNLEMKTLRGRNVAMKLKLLKLQKATGCVNVAAGLLPAMRASLVENIDPNASEYIHELEQRNLQVKILRGRNVAMKHKLLSLQKATQCLNVAAGLIPATPASTSLAETVDHETYEYKTQLEQQNLEMKILRGRNVAMKYKLLKLLKATRCLNVAAGLIPAVSSTSLDENIDPNVSENKHLLIEKNLEMNVLRERHAAMKRKLLKLQKATESINAAVGLIPPMLASSSLGDNVDPSAFDPHQLERKNITHHAFSIYQHLPEPNNLVDLIKSIFTIF